ncbi:MAG: hypothetical protein AAGG01_23245, partial [Planctomycetota bacterium]
PPQGDLTMKHSSLAKRTYLDLPQALKRSTAVLAAVLAASFLTGCERTRSVHVPAPPQPDRFTERAPNDSPDFPDFVGILDDRSFLVVDGYVEAVGFDIVDHIEFETDRPIEIDFTLQAYGAYGDVDVTIYDPIADEIVGTYATGGSYEAGTLIIHEPGRPFQFIIEAFVEDTAWSLELIAYPHGCACRTGAPDEGSSSLGTDHEQELSEAQVALPSPFVALKEHAILRLDDDAARID